MLPAAEIKNLRSELMKELKTHTGLLAAILREIQKLNGGEKK